MTKFRAWLSAARLRTLPLSLSGIFVGTAVANIYGYWDLHIFILALLTTVAFQITSNFANDYGDGVKGTDNEDRIGPKRAYQSGQLSKMELKTGIRISVVIDLFLVFLLLYFAFEEEDIKYIVLFVVLGIASIWAAIKYTVGSNAYGYKGFGDLFVFTFFGLLSVLGSMFLYTKFLTSTAVLPAASIGFLSTAVLNLNNLRDIESDKKANKNTVIVKIGLSKGKVYHYALIFMAFISMLAFIWNHYYSWKSGICLIAFVPLFIHLRLVSRIENPRNFDPELKKVALSTFLLGFLFYIGYNYFL
ncbi:MAG: 1,4-dihydroxy-2-naphthoate octaprenyltransferase [Eudoraea sp.]|uniref:1,4-dihydroxy-2-naphthoate octaprenyltransferase n=1 Tax=Eudoraea sp. TaxID=1979955 RepID=UPI003C707770